MRQPVHRIGVPPVYAVSSDHRSLPVPVTTLRSHGLNVSYAPIAVSPPQYVSAGTAKAAVSRQVATPKRRVVVTGGAGLIGKFLVDALLARKEFEVWVFDDYSNSDPSVVSKEAFQVEIDLTQHEKTVQEIIS